MKGLYILDSLKIGGAEILILDTVRNAAEMGVEPFLLITGSGGDLGDEIKKTKTKTFYLNRKYKLDLKVIKFTREIINKFSIDFVHADSPVGGIHGYLASRGLCKIFLTHHGFAHEDKIKDNLARRFLFPRVDANIFSSRISLDYFSKKYNKINNSQFLKNGVDFQKLDKAISSAKQEIIRKEYFVKKENINLGMVGNFYTSAKDQYTICRALSLLVPKYRGLHFYFLGGWPENNPEHYLKCYRFCEKIGILNNVHFVGLKKDIANFLKIIDFFVYSTNHDTHPLAVIEALGMGVPIIANDHPNILETTGNGKYITAFKSKNHLDLAEKISKLIDEKNPKADSSIKKWARKNYSIQTYLKNLRKIYLREIGSGRNL